MRKIIFSLIVLLSMSYASYAQCGDDLLKQALKEMGESQYIKDYTIELVKDKKDTKTGYVKFSVVLQSRTQYKFNLANGDTNPEQIILQA